MAKEYSVVNQLIRTYETLTSDLNRELNQMRTKISDARSNVNGMHTTFSTYASPDALGSVIELFELKKGENLGDYNAIFAAYDAYITDVENKYKEAEGKLSTLYDYQTRERNEDKVFKRWELSL